MSLSAAVIDALVQSGATVEQLAAAVKADMADREAALIAKRAKDTERQRRHRASRDVTVTDSDDCDTLPPLPPLKVSPDPIKNTPPISPNPKSMRGVELPDWLPAEPWAEFVAMRKAMRNAPWTPGAAKGIIGDLAKLRVEDHDPGKVLLRSVKLSYRGVFGHDETKGIVGSAAGWTPERQKAFLASLEPEKPPDDGKIAGNVLGLVRQVGGR